MNLVSVVSYSVIASSYKYVPLHSLLWINSTVIISRHKYSKHFLFSDTDKFELSLQIIQSIFSSTLHYKFHFNLNINYLIIQASINLVSNEIALFSNIEIPFHLFASCSAEFGKFSIIETREGLSVILQPVRD